MANLNWTLEAERWMREIFEYIARDNPIAAERTIEAIYNKAQQLCQFPESGYVYQRRKDRKVRILLYGHYRIAYLIRSESEIDILGVFHGAMEMDRYLPR